MTKLGALISKHHDLEYNVNSMYACISYANHISLSGAVKFQLNLQFYIAGTYTCAAQHHYVWLTINRVKLQCVKMSNIIFQYVWLCCKSSDHECYSKVKCLTNADLQLPRMNLTRHNT